MGVSVDGSGTVAFVADTHNNRIVQLRMSDGAPLGSPLTNFAPLHHVGVPLNRPRGVHWAVIQDPGNTWSRQEIRCLVVVDSGNNRVGLVKLTGVASYENAGSLSMGYELLWWRDGSATGGPRVCAAYPASSLLPAVCASACIVSRSTPVDTSHRTHLLHVCNSTLLLSRHAVPPACGGHGAPGQDLRER